MNLNMTPEAIIGLVVCGAVLVTGIVRGICSALEKKKGSL